MKAWQCILMIIGVEIGIHLIPWNGALSFLLGHWPVAIVVIIALALGLLIGKKIK